VIVLREWRIVVEMATLNELRSGAGDRTLRKGEKGSQREKVDREDVKIEVYGAGVEKGD